MANQEHNHIKFAIFTDSHLGHNITIPSLMNDSFNAFEESLKIAREKHVDIILHAGDLFDSSSPEKRIYTKTIEIINEYCFGNRNPQIQIINSQEHPAVQSLNTENPNLNIGLPIFVIQGNHDQASGIGLKSPLHILSSAGLINLFKIPENYDHLEINYILFKSGPIEVYVYGLGYIEKNTFQNIISNDGLLTFAKPPPPENPYIRRYSILLVHQDRPSFQNKTSNSEFLRERCKGIIDLIIWGHMHKNEIKFDTTNSPFICQPGCPIITDLKEENSSIKQMLILDISPIPECDIIEFPEIPSRPFIYKKVSLNTQRGKKSEDILKFLERKINKAISKSPRKDIIPIVRIEVSADGVDTSDVMYRNLDYIFSGRVANERIVQMIRKSRQSSNLKFDPSSSTEEMESSSVKAILDKLIEQDNMEFLMIKPLKECLQTVVDDPLGKCNIMQLINNIRKEQKDNAYDNFRRQIKEEDEVLTFPIAAELLHKAATSNSNGENERDKTKKSPEEVNDELPTRRKKGKASKKKQRKKSLKKIKKREMICHCQQVNRTHWMWMVMMKDKDHEEKKKLQIQSAKICGNKRLLKQ